MTEPIASDNNVITKISKWCVEHTALSLLTGLAFITLGLYIHDFFAAPSAASALAWYERVHWSTVFYHFFVILGEAIFVMFLLHVFIENANHHAHQQSTEKAIRKLEQNNVEILKEQKNRIEEVFGTMTKTFKDEGDKTVSALKDNLFAAILQDKMPAEIVQVVLENEFFSTNFLRKNLKIEYVYKGMEDQTLKIEQRINFDMQYITGKEDTINYSMPFSLSDTPLASYSFVEASYKIKVGKGDGPYTPLTQDHFKVQEDGDHKERDGFELREPIRLSKNEIINVEQVIAADYNIDDKGMFDSYYVNHHTIDVVVVFDLPKELEVGVYPTFPEKYLPKPHNSGTRKKFDKVKFLVPGQGFGFSIKPKKKQ